MQEILVAFIIAVIGILLLMVLYHTLHEVIMLALLQFFLQPLAEHWHLHCLLTKRKDDTNG